MRVLFTVQGEGRGHMTQAIAMNEMLQDRGHEVVSVLIGVNQSREVPQFFQSAFEAKVQQFRSPGFSIRGARKISLLGTISHFLGNLSEYGRSLDLIQGEIEKTRPDLIVNFLDPVMGYFNLRRRTRVPTLAVAHHFMFPHPRYPKPRFFTLRSFPMLRYVELTGANANRLGLSFYEAENLPKRRLFVCPPILRRQLFALESVKGDYLLVYLLNHGYAEDVKAWHAANPAIPIHCFYDKPGAAEVEEAAPGLWFHKLHGEKFLRMMSGARGVVCTAGFESISEAAYLNKPLLMVPVQNHMEQTINSLDAQLAGLGLRDTRFNLSRILDDLPDHQRLQFKNWVDRAAQIAVDAAESTAQGKGWRASRLGSPEEPAIQANIKSPE